jgi:hypothetical protein
MRIPHVAGVMAILSAQYIFSDVASLYAKTRELATKDDVTGLNNNTVNLLLYNGFDR